MSLQQPKLKPHQIPPFDPPTTISYTSTSTQFPRAIVLKMADATPRIPELKKPTAVHARRDRIRLIILVYRKQGMSTEEFQNYWRDEHSATFANLPVVKKNLLKYEQVRAAPLAPLRPTPPLRLWQ